MLFKYEDSCDSHVQKAGPWSCFPWERPVWGGPCLSGCHLLCLDLGGWVSHLEPAALRRWKLSDLAGSCGYVTTEAGTQAGGRGARPSLLREYLLPHRVQARAARALLCTPCPLPQHVRFTAVSLRTSPCSLISAHRAGTRLLIVPSTQPLSLVSFASFRPVYLAAGFARAASRLSTRLLLRFCLLT